MTNSKRVMVELKKKVVIDIPDIKYTHGREKIETLASSTAHAASSCPDDKLCDQLTGMFFHDKKRLSDNDRFTA